MRGKSRAGLITGLVISGFWLIFGQSGTALARADSHKRSDLRVSVYAPPTIPHEVESQVEELNCLDCHADNRTDAPMLPHQAYQNCRGCHISQEKTGLFKGNGFAGIPEPGSLPRAYPQAPPVSPHRYFMRENCLACHGRDSRSDIINTSHPDRISCRQCHVEQNREVSLFRTNTNIEDSLAK